MPALIKLLQTISDSIGSPLWFTIITFIILTILSLVFILQKLYAFYKYIKLKRDQRTLQSNLSHYYSTEDIQRATKYFIPLHYQESAPSIHEELGGGGIPVPKKQIIPEFIKSFFNTKSKHKFILVLADTGMGKTTFLINLYLKYIKKKSFFFSSPKSSIKLFPIGDPQTFIDIDNINNKENTILLLDALDEDIDAIKNYNNRLSEIMNKVKKFRFVIITCRTQFFPSEVEVPSRAGIFSWGGSGEYKFQKYYLSVFDGNDINKYLKKRFGIFRKNKKKKALKIIEKSTSLVVRPMLLNNIETLVETEKTYNYSFQIYEELIQKWLLREANKPNLQQLYTSKEKFRQSLYIFSGKLAEDLYENREKRDGYSIPKSEALPNEVLKELDISNESNILDEIAKSKSLLNRDANGKYKFSHKSILEYFLALKCFQDKQFYLNFDFFGMDATNNFLDEIIVFNLEKHGGYITIEKTESKLVPFNKLNFRLLKRTTNLVITQLETFHYIHFFNRAQNLTQILLDLRSEVEQVYILKDFFHYIGVIKKLLHLDKDNPFDIIHPIIKLIQKLEQRFKHSPALRVTTKSDLTTIIKVLQSHEDELSFFLETYPYKEYSPYRVTKSSYLSFLKINCAQIRSIVELVNKYKLHDIKSLDLTKKFILSSDEEIIGLPTRSMELIDRFTLTHTHINTYEVVYKTPMEEFEPILYSIADKLTKLDINKLKEELRETEIACKNIISIKRQNPLLKVNLIKISTNTPNELTISL